MPECQGQKFQNRNNCNIFLRYKEPRMDACGLTSSLSTIYPVRDRKTQTKRVSVETAHPSTGTPRGPFASGRAVSPLPGPLCPFPFFRSHIFPSLSGSMSHDLDVDDPSTPAAELTPGPATSTIPPTQIPPLIPNLLLRSLRASDPFEEAMKEESRACRESIEADLVVSETGSANPLSRRGP